MEILSSGRLLFWWKLVYLYAGWIIVMALGAIILLIELNIDNPNLSVEFISDYVEYRKNVYLVFLLLVLMLFGLSWIFSRVVNLQIDSGHRDIYINKQKCAVNDIRYIGEIVIFQMVIECIKYKGLIKFWVPKGAGISDLAWPLPVYFRKNTNIASVRSFLSVKEGD